MTVSGLCLASLDNQETWKAVAVACEPQTYFRSSLLFLRKRVKVEPKKPDALAT